MRAPAFTDGLPYDVPAEVATGPLDPRAHPPMRGNEYPATIVVEGQPAGEELRTVREAEAERGMTHAELMAIPEWPTQFGQREIEIHGKRVVAPVAPPRVAMFDPMGVTDALGHQWLLGTYKGVRYRQLLHANPAVAFQEKP